jgi:hypothetical protein
MIRDVRVLGLPFFSPRSSLAQAAGTTTASTIPLRPGLVVAVETPSALIAIEVSSCVSKEWLAC